MEQCILHGKKNKWHEDQAPLKGVLEEVEIIERAVICAHRHGWNAWNWRFQWPVASSVFHVPEICHKLFCELQLVLNERDAQTHCVTN